MKMFLLAMVLGGALSYGIESIPIDDIKASSTLLDQGGTTYRPENLIMKKNVHPFYQVWGAAYKDKPITLEFTVGAQRLDVITLYNGFMRDSASYVNNSLARTIKVYHNTKDNLVKTITLSKPKWRGYRAPRAEVIAFNKPLTNVGRIIIEIEDVYPGKKWNNVCMSLVKFWGFVKLPKKLKTGQLTDRRDGNKYATVKVGDQVWMAQDLRYRTPGSRTFVNSGKTKLRIPEGAGLEYPDSDIGDGICPAGWRLPTASEFEGLRAKLPSTASYDDLFAASSRRPYYSIHEYGELGGKKQYTTDVEVFFYPTDAYGLNMSTLTRYYYDGQCTEDNGETFAFASYWTLDTKDVPLWPDEDGNVEVKHMRHYRFGGSEYCEAMLSNEDYHFVRCVKGSALTDRRDGKVYKTAKIGNRTWMEQNLDYGGAPGECYEGDAGNCARFGRMYSRETAQTVCPEGWHLPSKEEYGDLIRTAEGKNLLAMGQGVVASLWTSTVADTATNAANTDTASTDTAVAGVYLKLLDFSFENEDGAEPQNLSVRCVKD